MYIDIFEKSNNNSIDSTGISQKSYSQPIKQSDMGHKRSTNCSIIGIREYTSNWRLMQGFSREVGCEMSH